MSILNGNSKRSQKPPAPVQLREEPPELPRAPQLPVRAPQDSRRHVLAERAAEAAQYVVDLEHERDVLRQSLGDAKSEIHFLRMTLEAASMETAKMRESRDYLVGQLAGLRSRADLLAKNLLDLVDDARKTQVEAPVNEFAPQPKRELVDLDRLGEEVMAQTEAIIRDEPLPSFLDKGQDDQRAHQT